MKPIENFDEIVSGNGGGERVEPGAYIIEFTAVEDNPTDEYLTLTWDIAEGAKKGAFSNEFGQSNPWAHQFRMYYRNTCAGMFKGFIERIEDCNPGYKWSWDEQTLRGKKIGVVFDKRLYTKRDGSDGDTLERGTFYSLDYIRQGKAREPKVIDKRESKPSTYSQTVAEPYEEFSVPF